MSLSLNFEPHSWYKGFAIQDNSNRHLPKIYQPSTEGLPSWYAVTANGMTGYLDEFEAGTLKELKQLITEYRSK